MRLELVFFVSKIAKGENLTGLFDKTNTDAIDCFIAFSDKFFCIILFEDLCCGLWCGCITFIDAISLFEFQDAAGFVYKII